MVGRQPSFFFFTFLSLHLKKQLCFATKKYLRASKEFGVCTDGNGLVEITVRTPFKHDRKRGNSSSFFLTFGREGRERKMNSWKIIIYSLMGLWWKLPIERWKSECGWEGSRRGLPFDPDEFALIQRLVSVMVFVGWLVECPRFAMKRWKRYILFVFLSISLSSLY